MSNNIIFSNLAYVKMFVHAMKYPQCAVNGILLKCKGSNDDTVNFVDAIPLFHICLHVSPMAEIALEQIDAYAAKNKQVIAGYYVANELISDRSIDKPYNKIADKIAENFGNAPLVLINNKQGLDVYQQVEGKWKPYDNDKITVPGEYIDDLLVGDVAQELVDFDNYLDDITLDWKNSEINSRVLECSR